jgi:Sec-independent protein translocase protein TatA
MKSVDYLTVAIIRGLLRLFHLSLQLLKLGAGAISAPIARVTEEWWVVLLEFLKLWQLYWKYGRAEFNSFRAFRNTMRGEADDQEQQTDSEKDDESKNTPPPKPTNAYTDALQLLGFSETDSLDRALLKRRHRELISRVHPDKGCPTTVLAQQINDAVKLVKQKRGWK